MFKIEDSVGDIIYVSFRDFQRFKDIGINRPSGHFFMRGIDNLGIWLEHPGIILAKTEDYTQVKLREIIIVLIKFFCAYFN